MPSLHALVDKYKAIVLEATGSSFPQAPDEQLDLAIMARSSTPWNTERANIYRRQERIPADPEPRSTCR